MAEANCGNCRYWRKGLHGQGHKNYDGKCCRYPPTVPDRDGDSNFAGTGEACWCGEHAPANPETAEEAATILAKYIILGDMTAARALADKLRE